MAFSHFHNDNLEELSGTAPLTILRKIALNVVKHESSKRSMKRKRKFAAWAMAF
jgi:hypothetical protein